ncbi:hypothetical protein COCCADRAFT_41530 [Bipolaris zeicola 26-R-13]|uniref:Uncharacterized protein n=1 Tax=Cochliobolus carbonum (strain 26-R-13) TaxID=930089 RepID=W6XKV4_COCC2|nr:uncharacterized protein COCCADRAFT_41530 [Bipolaris zeicola 26-R-13]EUC27842.1 hypothetical protein COCCADRAFT_41530 [Bipolaris zeicola 26-R-13]
MSVQYNTTTKAREYPDVGHGAASHHGVGDQFAVNGNAAQFNAVGQAEQYNFSGASSSMNVFIDSRNIQNSDCVDSNMSLSRTQANEFLKSLESRMMLAVPKSWQDLKWGHREQAVTKANPFWLQPKFQTWCSKSENTLRFVKGSYQNRSQIKNFCLDFIKLMEDARVPLLWALKPNACERANGFSPECVLSYLTVQALTVYLNQEKTSGISEKQAAQIHGKFQDASTLTDYIHLLCSSISISRLPEVCILVDVQLLDTRQQGFRGHIELMKALSTTQNRLHKDGSRTVVKALLVSYGGVIFDDHESPDVIKNVILAGNSRYGKGKPVQRRHEVGRLVSSHFGGRGRVRRL